MKVRMMAEIMLKVGDSPGLWKDGMPLHAFNDRKILWTNADMLCKSWHFGFTSSGLRDLSAVSRDYLELTSRWRFERISQTEVRRKNLLDLTEEVFSDIPREVDGEFQYIHVQDHIDHLTRSKRHNVFGEPGAEVWYGGTGIVDMPVLDQVWQKIEQKTLHRKVDHGLWPAGREETRVHFMFSVGDFTKDEAESLVERDLQLSQVEDEPDVMISIRKQICPWQDVLGLSGQTIASVRNKDKDVPRRPEVVHNLETVFPTWQR